MDTIETPNLKIRNVTVLGAGTMGHGIAAQAARCGYEVMLYDLAESALDQGLDRIRASYDKAVSRQKMTEAEAEAALGRVSGCTDLAQAVTEADLVVEAAPERMPLKREIFQVLEAEAPSHAVLASNTSSLSITEIASATRCPDRVLGMHFFNPVVIMPLLEIVRGEYTSEATVAAAQAFGEDLGKTCIVVRDAPGFATSRLGIALGNEAMRMVEEGVASPEDIDKAMTLGYRHPIGPLALTDLVGLDVRLAITEHLHRELGTDTFRPPQILKRMVRAGKLGRKTGQGFYTYDS
ncbi:MAG: 3-hydroxyacyl-CoA dehydrogenase family protein [Bradymonadia bacterium]